MLEQQSKLLKVFTFRKIAIPVVIGLSVASYLVYRNFDASVFRDIKWVWDTFFWLFIALFLMVVRDFAYMYRIRLLTDKYLSWKRSFQVIMLWEFASSITPSVVGGSAVALYVVNKEGINMGKTTAIVLITSLLDEMFYILMVPIVILIVGYQDLFIENAEFAFFNTKFGSLGIFMIGYTFMIILCIIIISGVFFNPRGLKMLLIKISRFFRKSRIKALRNLQKGAIKTGDQIITTSKEMKGKPFVFWLSAFGATFFSWTARFWVVNSLIMAFMAVDNHMLIYARQLIMWVILLISPTPGGSGVAEFVFSDFLGDFIIIGLAPALALLWRLISYYPYIFIGAIVLPGWIRRIYN